ncbi:hypothetical protein GCM10010252_76640 [Streptomyces aureoverticillatus]|nr:hypothetical protein GCM10010252_76640 [Streptomyces aureoverticillatus]
MRQIGLFQTVWAQSLRRRRIPPDLHGRSFAALRPLMQGTSPLGAAVAAPLLVHGGLGVSVLVMTTLAGLPGLYLLLSSTDRPSGLEPTPKTAGTGEVRSAPARG